VGAENFVPTGIGSRTLQPVASQYIDYGIPDPEFQYSSIILNTSNFKNLGATLIHQTCMNENIKRTSKFAECWIPFRLACVVPFAVEIKIHRIIIFSCFYVCVYVCELLSLTLIGQRRVSENGIRGRKKQGDGKKTLRQGTSRFVLLTK